MSRIVLGEAKLYVETIAENDKDEMALMEANYKYSQDNIESVYVEVVTKDGKVHKIEVMGAEFNFQDLAD